MKKVIGLALILATVLILTGCDTLTALASPTTSITFETSEPVETVSTTRTTTTPTTTVMKIGTRDNPAPVGHKAIVTGESMFEKFKYDITVTEVIRGDNAKSLVMKENKYNKIPSGKEVVLLKCKLNLIEYEPEDKNDGFYVSDFQFDFFDKSMTKIKNESLVIPEEFTGEMFEGGSASGYVHAVVPKGEKLMARYDDFVWFNIG